jgi:hypothetical protein
MFMYGRLRQPSQVNTLIKVMNHHFHRKGSMLMCFMCCAQTTSAEYFLANGKRSSRFLSLELYLACFIAKLSENGGEAA